VSSEQTAFLLTAVALLSLGCAGSARTPEAPPSRTETAPAARDGAREPSPRGQALEPGGVVFLSAVPLQVSERAKKLAATSESDAAFGSALRVRIELMGLSKSFGELSQRTKRTAVNGTFQLEGVADITSRDVPAKNDGRSSFIVDYEEAAFSSAVTAFEGSGEPVTPDAISAFASRFIEDKTYTRGFDVASRVATTRAGDCTEHAVFTAALLRRFGFRARVIFGIVIVGLSGKAKPPEVLAFGHAWVEQYDRKRWKIVDSALGSERGQGERVGAPGLPADIHVRLVYLPINVLRDESAGYRRALMDEVGVDSVRRIEIDVRSGKAPEGPP